MIARHARRAIVLGAALSTLLASAAAAQRVTPGLEVGASQLRLGDSASFTAAAVTPSFLVDWDRASFGAVGTFSQFAGGWSTQGSLQGSLYTPPRGLFVGELSGLTGGTAHEDGSRTGQTVATARAHLMTDTRGAWLGGGVGESWDGGTWRPVREAELGAWLEAGPATAVATVTPTVADTLRYTDVELAARWALAQADIGLAAGARAGDQLPNVGGSTRLWLSMGVSRWLAPTVALVGSVGSYPPDPTQGFPGGRFASIGVRFGPRLDRDRTRAAMSEPPVADGLLSLTVASAAEGRRTIRVRAPGASRVELNADFTDWRAVQLTRAGNGWWVITLPVAPGTYQLNVRVDGGAWLVPPGLTVVRDEFGGSVGVLVVH